MLTSEQRDALKWAIDVADGILAVSRRGSPIREIETLRTMLAASAAPAEGVVVPLKVVQLLGLVRKDGVLKRSSELQEAFRLIDSAALATAPTMSEADVQQGDTWHYRVSKGAGCSTGYIAEKSKLTVKVTQNKFTDYGCRFVTNEIEWIECIDRAAAKGESDAKS